MAFMNAVRTISGSNNLFYLKRGHDRIPIKPQYPVLKKKLENMPTSNPTPNATEYKAFDFFPLSPDLSLSEPSNAELKQQLDESNTEVANLKHQLSSVRAQMKLSVEESVMVSEAHLEQRMDDRMEDIEEKLMMKMEKSVDLRVKLELFFASVYVFVVCMFGALLARAVYQ